MDQTQSSYQVIARKYRPKTFQEVIGQDPIVKTLKGALKFNRLAHAYLFSGSRGTGKTTLARIFAKALNCENLSSDFEPCSACRSCLEIAAGSSIDVMEIDGASHRGIDDIRVISESVGYSSSQGRYKIYIIDEVHMLTKEAFNALLKTLEEPPPKVKFFFATTEPQKVPQTILSRCQRFYLRRIELSFIVKKLELIATDQKVAVEEGVLKRIAEFAEGGLRDAESLFDQIIAFSDGTITLDMINEISGTLPRKWFLELDRAFNESNFQTCFRMAEELFLQGKDINHFLDDLITHYRSLLLLKLVPTSPLPELETNYRDTLKATQLFYSQEHCLTILQLIIDAKNNLKGTVSERIALETLLFNIVREKSRISIAYLTRRLSELERAMNAPQVAQKQLEEKPIVATTLTPPAPPRKKAPSLPSEPIQPTDARLEILPALAKRSQEPASAPSQPSPIATYDDMQKKSHYDTLIQFAAIELDGTVQRKTDERRK